MTMAGKAIRKRGPTVGNAHAAGGPALRPVGTTASGAIDSRPQTSIVHWSFLVPPALLVACVVWAYWTVIGDMAERWSDDPQYSHGYFVPLFSAFLLWFRRDAFDRESLSPSWWSIPLLGVGVGLWAVGTYYFLNFFASLSLLWCLAALALVAGGKTALRWSWPSILFLGFMLPLPYRLHTALGGGLQRVATIVSTYLLQTFGATAIREGNVILIDDVKIGVVEACSGLGMMVTFFALATALALMLRSSPTWLRLALVASAVPVAIAANVARITVTGLLYSSSQDRLARVVFHDLAGWLMMPLAIGLLLGELYVLRRLVLGPAPDVTDDDVPVRLPRVRAKAPPAHVTNGAKSAS
jgi:exosortase